MPALTGEPWRGRAEATVRQVASPANHHIAVVSFDGGGIVTGMGDSGTWEGDAGTSLTLAFRWTANALGSSQQDPNFATVEARVPGTGTVLSTWTVAFPANNVEVTRTWHFDDSPLNATLGALRAGTVELYLNWGSTGGAVPWNADSRGAGGGILAGNEVANARGYARSKAFITAHSVSNVAIGGADPALYAADDPLHTRVTTTQWYRALAPTLLLTVPGGATERSGVSASTVGPNIDWSFTATSGTSRRLGAGMVQAAALKSLQAFLPTLDFGGDNEYAWATSGHEAGWTSDGAFSATRANRITVDPRTTVDHHMQHGDNVLGTPPGSKDVNPKSRLQSDLSFVAFRLLNARGEGLNGVSVTEKLWDANNLAFTEAAPKVNRTVTTATVGGEAGWAPNLTNATWDSSLPGGGWTHKVDVQTAHLADVETNPTETYTLLAVNSSFVLTVAGGPLNALSHVVVGTGFHVSVNLIDTNTRKRVPITSARAILTRYNDVTGYDEYLDADGVTWVPIDADTDVLHAHTLVETAADSNVFDAEWTAGQTAAWGEYDIFVVAQAIESSGVPYAGMQKESVVGPHHSHSARAKNLQWLGIPA